MHHTIGGRYIDGIIGETVKRCRREGMMLSIKRYDGHAVECRGNRVVILRHVLLHKLLQDCSTVRCDQTIVFCIANSIIYGRPNRKETGALKYCRKVTLVGKSSKLRQLLVTGDILPQR